MARHAVSGVWNGCLSAGALAVAALLALPAYAQDLNETPATLTHAQEIVSAARPDQAALSALLEKTLSAPGNVTIDNIRLKTADYRGLYAAVGWQPLWVDAHGLNARAQQALRLIETAGEDGLPSSAYGLSAIHALQNAHSLAGADDLRGLAFMDLLVSRAIAAYGRDLSMGATPAGQRLLGGFMSRSVEPAEILEAAYIHNGIGSVLQSYAPAGADYAVLRRLLAEYRTLEREGGWKPWQTRRVVKPGERDARIPLLREILGTMRDFEGDLASDAYDDGLKEAVLRFQSRHGLNPTGILNQATQKALAVPIENRIGQIVATLERMRWMPREMGERYLVVNIAASELRAYADEREALSMRVIVGRPGTRTPQFSSIVNEVIFNPTWSPTDSIIRKEMLPKLRENPDYFIRAGFTITQDGEPIDPYSADPESGGVFHFRQSAGRGNALGKIKFNMPDTDDIYLHSTANPELFAREERSLSHGCIRLEKPRDLAHFVMDGLGEWNESKVNATYDSSTTRHVRVPTVAVHVVYWTAWVDGQGTAHFYNDTYRHDEALTARLAPKEKEPVKLAEK